jgi:type II secretory pathway component PulF
MKNFFWKGIDTLGKHKKGYLHATSKDHLQSELLAKGIALLSCKSEKKAWGFTFLKKVNLLQKAFFFERLAVLCESGVDLIQALKLVANQVDSKLLRDAVMNIIDDIIFGKTLVDAMERHKDIFSSFVINVVRSGEHVGKLGFALKKISEYLNARVLTQKKIKQAAFAPLVTLCVSCVVFLGIFTFVIPQFELFFTSMQGELPQITKFVISARSFFGSSYILLMIIVFLCVLLFLKKICLPAKIQRIKDAITLKILFMGNVILLYDLISFLQMLALFLKTGVDVKVALHNASFVVRNAVVKEKILLVEEEVTKGLSLSESFRLVGKNYFPENLIAIVTVGEGTGKLDAMLEKSVHFFQRELDKKLKCAVNVFQPMFMLVVGVLIFFLILSVYLPIFNMARLI